MIRVGKAEAIRLLWILSLAGLYGAARVLGDASPLLMPSPGQIFRAFLDGVAEGTLLKQAAFSLLLVALALAAGTVVSFLLLFISGRKTGNPGSFYWGRSLVETLTALFHPLPGIALLPLIILWIGTGTPAVFFILIHSIIWPLTTNLLSGFDQLPEIYGLIGKNYQLSPWQTFTRIEVPGTFPFLLAGWRIGWARGWRALISAEMVFGALGGGGCMWWFIFQRRVFMDTPGLFAGLLVVLLLGLLVEGVFFGRLQKSRFARGRLV